MDFAGHDLQKYQYNCNSLGMDSSKVGSSSQHPRKVVEVDAWWSLQQVVEVVVVAEAAVVEVVATTMGNLQPLIFPKLEKSSRPWLQDPI